METCCSIRGDNRLVRRFGGDKNPGAKKKAITAIAHTLLKTAYQVLKTSTPYQDLGPDFYTRRESPAQRQAYLERQLQKVPPGLHHHHHHQPVTGRLTRRPRITIPSPETPPIPATRPYPPDKPALSTSPGHRTGQGSLPRSTGTQVSYQQIR